MNNIVGLNKMNKIIDWCNKNQNKINSIKINSELGVPFDNMEIVIVFKNNYEIILCNETYDIGIYEDINYDIEDIDFFLNAFSSNKVENYFNILRR